MLAPTLRASSTCAVEQRRALPWRQAGGGVEHNGAGCFGGQAFTRLGASRHFGAVGAARALDIHGAF